MSLLARTHITPDNQGPIVSVVAWTLIAAVLLVSGLKLSLASASIGLQPDDLFVVISTPNNIQSQVLSIAHSVAVSVQVYFGAGRPQLSLSDSYLQRYQKAGYTADIFFILTLAVTKLTILAFLRQITPCHKHHKAIYGLGFFIVAWGVGATAAALFQCHLPQPWAIASDQCFDQIAFWHSFGALNIASEILLIALPVYIIWGVQLSHGSKAIVLTCFAMRGVVIIAAAFKIAYVQILAMASRDNLTFDGWRYLLMTVIVQSLSVITVSIPSIKTLLMGLESGMLRTGHFHLRTRYISGQYFKSKNLAAPSFVAMAHHDGLLRPPAPSRLPSDYKSQHFTTQLVVIESEVDYEIDCRNEILGFGHHVVVAEHPEDARSQDTVHLEWPRAVWQPSRQS